MAKRVLVIEDNRDAVTALKVLLEILGCEVAVAHDGSTGIERAKTFDPSLILCDIGLPGEADGFAVARAIRKMPECKSAMLVAVTGYAGSDDRERALEAGFDLHLGKPVEASRLRSLLDLD